MEGTKDGEYSPREMQRASERERLEEIDRGGKRKGCSHSHRHTSTETERERDK